MNDVIKKYNIFLKTPCKLLTGQSKKENDSQIGTNSLRERRAIARVCVARVRHLDTSDEAPRGTIPVPFQLTRSGIARVRQKHPVDGRFQKRYAPLSRHFVVPFVDRLF